MRPDGTNEERDMHTLPSRPRDDHWVGVTLSPALAKEVARALRIQLACALERPFDGSLPTREDVARLRTVLDRSVDQLATLAWGEPTGDVRMNGPRAVLEALAQELLDGANERLANPLGWNAPDAHRVRRQARWMIRAADAINEALASEPEYQLAW
jgi:hypothetical protein